MQEKDRELLKLCKRLKANDNTLTYLNPVPYNDISNTQIIALMEALINNRFVASLGIYSGHLTSSSMKAIAVMLQNNKSLTWLSFSQSKIEDADSCIKILAETLKTNQALKSLSLTSNKISAIGAQALAEMLTCNQTLNSLSLVYNTISDAGAEALAKALRSNKALTSLYLGNNNIGTTGIQVLGETLKYNNTLTSLALDGNNLDYKAMQTLTMGLKNNKTLTSLDLQNCNLDDNSVQLLADAIKTHPHLTSLLLSNNNISSLGAQALAAALVDNSALTKLDLSSNKIDEAGAKALAKVFATRTRLSWLLLGYNNIGDVGAQALAEAIKNNKTLTFLDFQNNNNISLIGIQALVDALKNNMTLTTLYLNPSYGGEAAAAANIVYAYVRRNQDLRNRFLAAAEKGDITTLQALLKQGVAITDDKEPNNLTALHLAAQKGQLDTVKFLVEKGSSVTAKTDEDKTPLDLARQQGHKTIIEYFNTLNNQTFISASSPTDQANLSEYTNFDKKSKFSSTDSQQVNPSTQPLGCKTTTSSNYVDFSKKEQKQALPQAPTQIPYQSLVFQQLLAKGAFGTVYKGSYQQQEVALKQLDVVNLTDQAKKEIEREARILARLNSPWVVQLIGMCIETRCVLVLEYCKGGSLEHRLQSNQTILWPQRWQWSFQIASGLAYLHSQKILHRDLAARNVVLDNQDQAKLTDFGLSETRTYTSGTLQHASSDKLPIAWTAPELLVFGAKSTKKGDVYSLGVTLWEIASRSIPLKGIKQPQSIVIDAIKSGYRETISQDTPKDYTSLIQLCWHEKPTFRPTAGKAAKYLKDSQPQAETLSLSFFGTTQTALQQKLSGVLQQGYSWQCQLQGSILKLTLSKQQLSQTELNSFLIKGVLQEVKSAIKSNISWLKKENLCINNNELTITTTDNNQAQAIKKLLSEVGLLSSSHIVEVKRTF